MSIILCPPASAPSLDPSWLVPHPGFGWTALYRNGVRVWEDLDGCWDEDGWTVADLTEWCPVRQGVGWKLEVYGPMVIERYRLRRGRWTLVERENGFA